ncbi:hypothetical protein GF312_03040 [Candidatus Poribacteria bacterium]|nr:hypothetical protein [Candidatus Poribacteria bacterium]
MVQGGKNQMDSLIFLLGLTTYVYGNIDISSNYTGNVFIDNQEVNLNIDVLSEAVISVTNYNGDEVFKKELPSGKSEIFIGALPRGHYVVSVESGEDKKNVYMAVVPSPDKHIRDRESRIASDLATSWLVEPDKFDELAELTNLAGVNWIRDRIRWGEIEPERGKFAEDTRYDRSAEIQVKNGLNVYQVFHDTPPWATEGEKRRSFPNDLRDAYNFAVQMAERFDGKVKAWEVWNEPDIPNFSDELGDSYAALLKTMYLGFKSFDPDLSVLLCSFAHGPGRFAETVFENNVNDFFDIYNYHIYDKWENHSDRALKHIQVMRRYGLERKPIWLTEAGHAVKRLPDLVELTEEQGHEVAEFLPKAIITTLSAKVDKYFWFILPYYRENDVMLFGLLRQDMTPTAGYSTLAACTYALGEAYHLGRLDISGVNIQVFRRGDGNLTLAYWSKSSERKFKIRVETDTAQLINIMGKEKEIEVKSGRLNLVADTSVKYLVLPVDAMGYSLRKENIKEISEPESFDLGNICHLVMHLRFPRKCWNKKEDVYSIPEDSPTIVNIEVYNFGEDSFSGSLSFVSPKGWKAEIDNDGVNIKPMEKVIRKLTLSPDESSSEAVQLRLNLLSSIGKAETYALSYLAPGKTE